jgi:photosystem II stability/assembly factor-like uncharacterized protein
LVPDTQIGQWSQISISANGQYQTAANYGYGLYTSSDYGESWSLTSTNLNYNVVAVSGNGQYQTALVDQGGLYTSNNYGSSWSLNNSAPRGIAWSGIAISSNGQYQTAIASNTDSSSGVYISNNYGSTWSLNSSAPKNLLWSGIAISSNGQYQTAIASSGSGSNSAIYISNDYGTTWTINSNMSISLNYKSIAVSSTGQVQVLVTNGGGIYISNNYGATWSQAQNAPSKENWSSISISSTGDYMSASINNSGKRPGAIYTSTDNGKTWIYNKNSPYGLNYESIAMSSDGSYQTVIVSGDSIYTTNTQSQTMLLINNYSQTNTISVCIEQQYEQIQFGLCFEDALDFDYDYNDLVTNTVYTIIRNKYGVKKFIGDFHLTARSAGFDHSIGVSFSGLRTLPNGSMRSGSWSVHRYSGYNGTAYDDGNAVLTYLLQPTNSKQNFAILREDAVPFVISTSSALPTDNVGDSFSVNCYNRTPTHTIWTPPTTSRIIIDFDNSNELVTNGQYFLPFIDVRNSPNITPTYSNYIHRHYLGSTVDFSIKQFVYRGVQMTFTGFQKVLLTPIDFRISEDNGNLPGHYRIIDVYTDFVNYMTQGMYPLHSSIVDMTQIRSILNYLEKTSAWCNNTEFINSDELILTESTDYSYNVPVDSKENFGQYVNANILLMGNHAALISSIDQIVPANTEQFLFQISGESGTTNVAFTDYIQGLPSGTGFISISNSQNDSGIIYFLLTDASGIGYIVGTNNTSNNMYSTVAFNTTNIIKLKNGISNLLTLNSNNALYTTDPTHDVSPHNTSGRAIVDMCYMNDIYILSTGTKNDLVITTNDTVNNPTSNINTSGLPLVMSLDASTTAIAVLTTNNLVYLLDTDGNNVQVFNDYLINNISINNNNVVGLANDGTVYLCDISLGLTSLTSSVEIATSVASISSNDNWIALTKYNGTISTYGNVPSDLSIAIAAYNLPSYGGLIGLTVYQNSLIVSYC